MMEKRREKRIGTAVIIAAILAGTAGGCADPGKEGTEALRTGNYEEAKALFEEAAESEDQKEAAEGFRGLGMTYYETEDYTAALDAFEKAVDSGAGQTVQLCHLMSICAMQTEDYAAALGYIQAGLDLEDSGKSRDGENTADAGMLQEMRYNEIICYERRADWENAKQKAEEYLRDYPEDENIRREAEFLQTR